MTPNKFTHIKDIFSITAVYGTHHQTVFLTKPINRYFKQLFKFSNS